MGRGLIRGILTFPCDDHYRPPNATWRTISVHSLAVWLAKLEKKDEVRRIMTQIGSLLAVATVLLTYGLHFIVREGGGGLYARQNYLCRNLS